MRTFGLVTASLFLMMLFGSCYITTQGARYMALRSRAVPVDRALADPRTPAKIRTFLDRAVAVGTFARSEIGLKATRNYSSIVELDSDRLATVVSACAELSFDRFLWSYPLVGKLPYRGYFEAKGAEVEAARLKKLGFDVIVRPVDAFSTLGWLSDPLFSFMADYGEAEIAELVIHEMTHATVFVRGAEQFNEELATFVGRRGSMLWLESVHDPVSPVLSNLRRDRADGETFSAWLRGTAEGLSKIYEAPIPDSDKRSRKAELIAARAAAFRADYSTLFSTDRYRDFPMDRLNNAYLDLYRLYEGEPGLYRDFLEGVCGGSLKRFVEEVSRIAKKGGDPKEAMRKALGDQTFIGPPVPSPDRGRSAPLDIRG